MVFCDQKPQWGRHAKKSSSGAGGQTHRKSRHVVLLSCKAFDLRDAIKSFAPAVGPQTAIIPLLNGMRHLDVLDESFGKDRVLGGQCGIAVTLDEHRHVVQLTPVFQSLTFGERDGTMSNRVRTIAETFSAGNIGSQASENIMQEMWEKWVLLATLASSTSLMRAAVGHILAAPGGRDFMLGVRDERSAVASRQIMRRVKHF